MAFPGVMYGCESWTIKKAECRRTDAFELWCWKRLLSFPWTTRRYNQSILKEISPGCSLERLMFKLKLQYFGYLMRRADSFEKTLMLGKIEGRRIRGWQRIIWLGDITNSMDMSLNKLRELVKDREPGVLQSIRLKRPDAIILVFWMLSFKPIFSLSSFTFIQRLFSYSLLSAIKVVSSAYLRLLIFLPEVLITACTSTSPVFLMMYSA